MRIRYDIKGVTLIELMITLAVFSIIFGMVYSVYNTFIRQASIERKTEKTELDVVATFWPMMKDIENAGFGTPKTPENVLCRDSVRLENGELIIHSTAGGADKYSGRWSYIKGDDCTVEDLSDISTTDNKAIILSGDTDKKCIGISRVMNGKLVPCDSDNYRGQFAYWMPDDPDNPVTSCNELNTKLGCYEIIYSLRQYSTSSDIPEMCRNTGVSVLRKSILKRIDTTNTNRQPFIDCVLALYFRFGCIEGTSLNWRDTPSCSLGGKLRYVRIGMLIQSSPRKDIQGPQTITLFEDTGAPININLNDEQRYYRWRKVEQTILLKNN